MLALAGAAAAASGGCAKDKESLVLATITASPADDTLGTLRLTIAGTTRTFPLGSGLGSTSVTYGVWVPEDQTGSVSVVAVATRAGSDPCSGYTGSGTAVIAAAGATAEATITMSPGNVCPADGGSPDHGPVTTRTCTEFNHNATSGTCDVTLGTDTTITDVAFTRNGKYLFTAGDDGRVKVWNWDGSTPTPEGTVFSTTGHTYLAVSRNSELVAAGSELGALTIWNVGVPWQPAAVLTGLDNNIYGVAFSPDGQTLYAVDDVGYLSMFTSASTAIAGSVSLRSTPYVIASSPLMSDGTFWLAIGYFNGSAGLFNVAANGALAPEVPFTVSSTAASVFAIQFSPDGTRVAAGAEDGTIGIWPVPLTGGARLSPPISINTDYINYLAFSPDGADIAIGAGSDDAYRLLGVWNIASGAQRISYPSIVYRPFSVAYSPEGMLAVGAHSCGSVLICPAK